MTDTLIAKGGRCVVINALHKSIEEHKKKQKKHGTGGQKMRKIHRLTKLRGDIPFVYKRTTIYDMCILINALIDRVNLLCDFMEEQKKGVMDGN